uniref:hypothetical protein n=1 Tax=Pararhizobium sp. IMCC3301 TaxID=3067904 RepID=UPI00274053B2|nr:hypothetical protein [Pararhizobium sp. IMCC3301]
MISFKHRVIGATLTAGLFVPGLAFAAPDAIAVADRLVEIMETSASDASYESAQYNAADDTVTIVNLAFTEDKDTGSFATVIIQGYDEANTGGFGADRVTASGFELVNDKAQILISELSIANLDIPSVDVDTDDPESWNQVTYTSLEFANIRAIPKGSDPITVALVKSAINYTGDDGISGNGSLSIDDLSVPAQIMEGEARAFMKASGYDSLELDITVDAAYDAIAKTLDLNTLTVDAQNMGVVNFSAQMGGIPKDLLRDSAQMQGLMATATLRGARLSFANASIFDKGLDFAAGLTGQDPAQLKAQAPFVLGFGLAQINNEAFTKMVTRAVTDFLDDPRSLTVTIAPENPVPVAQIAGAAMSSPKVVPDLLGVAVVANQ